MDWILEKNYIPSLEDISQCYSMTTRAVQEFIDVNGKSITLVDFGGRRPHRTSWIDWFPNAGLVIFVASLSDYNEVLAEDQKTVGRVICLPIH